MRNIFIVGPASVGKTTLGTLLAGKLKYLFVDIDEEFRSRIALIPDYVKAYGYSGYSERNSELADQLVKESPQNTVFATPSGFLVHEGLPHLVAKHAEPVKKNAVSVLLLPHRDPSQAVDVIVNRQASRWTDIDLERERTRFLDRFPKYQKFGDIQIYSLAEPSVIAAMAEKEIRPLI